MHNRVDRDTGSEKVITYGTYESTIDRYTKQPLIDHNNQDTPLNQ